MDDQHHCVYSLICFNLACDIYAYIVSHATVRLNTFEQRSLGLFIRRPTMGKTIGEPGWSVGVSAVKTLRNGDFRLRNASSHSILRIHLNQCYLY